VLDGTKNEMGLMDQFNEALNSLVRNPFVDLSPLPSLCWKPPKPMPALARGPGFDRREQESPRREGPSTTMGIGLENFES